MFGCGSCFLGVLLSSAILQCATSVTGNPYIVCIKYKLSNVAIVYDQILLFNIFLYMGGVNVAW